MRYLKICYWEILYTEYCVTLKVLLILRICIHLVNKLHCNLAFSVETFGTMKECVSWKLRYYEKQRYLETAFFFVFFLNNCVT